MRVMSWLTNAAVAGLLAVSLCPGMAGAAGESYGLRYEIIGQAERVLKQAAVTSPNWHWRREAIQRDVHDITFLLEQAWRAKEKANEVAKKDYAHQALTLLQRAVARGHFDAEVIEPVLRVIRQLLPDVAI